MMKCFVLQTMATAGYTTCKSFSGRRNNQWSKEDSGPKEKQVAGPLLPSAPARSSDHFHIIWADTADVALAAEDV